MTARRRLWRVLAGVLALVPAQLVAAPGQVRELRVWDAPESTRVVLELSAPVDYQMFALSNPPRVVLDLAQVPRPADVAYVADAASPVAAVRYGSPRAGTTRVVLDLRRTQHFEGFLLPPNERYGHRLVVDLYAEPPALRMADAAPPLAPAATPSGVQPGTGLVRGVAGDMPAEVATLPGPATTAPGARPAAASGPANLAQRAGDSAPTLPGAAQAALAQPPLAAARAPADSAPLPARVRARRSGAVGTPLVIVIDAGHGGEDPGAIGKGGTREKDVVLAIAKALAARVDREPGMRAVLTRKGDYFLPLRGRVTAAHRANADLFVSIHADAAVNRNARGSGVYALSAGGASNEAARLLAAKENAADAIGGVPVVDTADPMLRSVLLDLSQNATTESGLRLAQDLLGAVRGVNTVHQSRVQQAGFVVLKSPHVPSVLVETAFISNPDEERKLRDPAFHSRLAGALLTGLKRHVGADPRLSTRLAQARGEAPLTGRGVLAASAADASR